MREIGTAEREPGGGGDLLDFGLLGAFGRERFLGLVFDGEIVSLVVGPLHGGSRLGFLRRWSFALAGSGLGWCGGLGRVVAVLGRCFFGRALLAAKFLYVLAGRRALAGFFFFFFLKILT